MSNSQHEVIIKLTDQATQGLKKIETETKNVSFSMGSLAKLAVGAVGFIGISQGIRASIGAMQDQVRVNTQLEAVLKSTNNAVGLSSEAIQKMASDLQGLTTFQDDTIQAGQNMLLTFTNIGGEVFPKATETLLDMATAMSGGMTPGAEALTSQAIQLGKALNDPINGITALTRVGVTFTEGQKNMIEGMVKAGDTISAQKIILAELNREFGGSAQAQAKTFAGRMQQIGNSVADIAEIIGFALLPALTKGANYLKVLALRAVQFFNDNSEAITNLANIVFEFFSEIFSSVVGVLQSLASTALQVFQSIFGNSKETGIGIMDVFRGLFLAISIGFQGFALGVSMIMRTVGLIFRGTLLAVRGIVLTIVENLGNFVGNIAIIIQGVLNIVIKGINMVFTALGKAPIEPINSMTTAFSSFKDEMKAQNKDLTADATKAWDDYAEGMSGDIMKASEKMGKSMDAFGSNVKGVQIDLKGLALDGAMGMNKVAEATNGAGGATKGKKEEMKKLKDEAEKAVKTMIDGFEKTKKEIGDAQDKLKSITSDWVKFKDEGLKALGKVNNEIAKFNSETGKITIGFKTEQDNSLAQRAVEIKKQLAEINTGGGDSSQQSSLLEEQAFIQKTISQELITQAENYDKLSQAQKTVVDSQKKMSDELKKREEDLMVLSEKKAILEAQANQKNMAEKRIKIEEENGIVKAFYQDSAGKLVEIKNQENIDLAQSVLDKQNTLEKDYNDTNQLLKRKLSLQKSHLEDLKLAYKQYHDNLNLETKKMSEQLIGFYDSISAKLKELIALQRTAGTSGLGGSNSVGTRAFGGQVSNGEAYLVGEKGPELFVPSTSGSVVANDKLGGGGINVTINMGGVTVRDSQDIDSLASKVGDVLTRQLQLNKFGIS